MEKKNVKLSIALAVFNEAKNISKCLTAIFNIADEIVIVDGGSTDGTLTEVEKFGARIINTDNPPIFHINKQKALDACTSDWILQLDADEIIPEDLKKEILSTINHEQTTINGYYIARRNYFWGHFMRKGGQYPDAVIRLVRRGYATFPCKSVHEQIMVEGRVDTLVHPMDHYSYRTRADYWKKADTYTSLTAKEIRIASSGVFSTFFRFCIVKPVVTFFSLFLRHKGFVDGLTGFEFALYSALHFPIAFVKSIKRV